MAESVVSNFVLSKWNARALGIKNIIDWLNWSKRRPVIQQRKAVVPDSVPKILQGKLSSLAKAVFNSDDKFMVTGEQNPTVFSFANGEICKSLEKPNAIQADEHPIQLFAFLRFLLAKDRMLSLGNREHSWRWQKL